MNISKLFSILLLTSSCSLQELQVVDAEKIYSISLIDKNNIELPVIRPKTNNLFSEKEVTLFQLAINAWAEATENNCFLNISVNDTQSINVDYWTQYATTHCNTSNDGVVAFYLPNSFIGICFKTLSDDYFYKVLLHEIGHHFRYKKAVIHLEAGNTMSTTINTQPGYLTKEDINFNYE